MTPDGHPTYHLTQAALREPDLTVTQKTERIQYQSVSNSCYNGLSSLAAFGRLTFDPFCFSFNLGHKAAQRCPKPIA